MVAKLNSRFHFFLRKLKSFLLLALFHNLFLSFLPEVIPNIKVGSIFCADLWTKIDYSPLVLITVLYVLEYCRNPPDCVTLNLVNLFDDGVTVL